MKSAMFFMAFSASIKDGKKYFLALNTVRNGENISVSGIRIRSEYRKSSKPFGRSVNIYLSVNSLSPVIVFRIALSTILYLEVQREVCSALHIISLSLHMIQGSIPVFFSKGQKVSIILQPSSLRRKSAVFARKTAKTPEKLTVFQGGGAVDSISIHKTMVEATGLEPTTSWSLTKRATKLRYTSIFTVLIFVRPFHDLLVPSSPHSALFSHRPAGQCSLSRSAAPLPKNLASLCSLRFPGALIDARYQTALSPRFCNYKIALGRSIGTAYTIIHFFP